MAWRCGCFPLQSASPELQFRVACGCHKLALVPSVCKATPKVASLLFSPHLRHFSPWPHVHWEEAILSLTSLCSPLKISLHYILNFQHCHCCFCHQPLSYIPDSCREIQSHCLEGLNETLSPAPWTLLKKKFRWLLLMCAEYPQYLGRSSWKILSNYFNFFFCFLMHIIVWIFS